MPARLPKVLLPLCVLSALAGCGGGGNDDPPEPTNRAPVLTTTALAATEDTALAAQIAATDADGNALTFTRVNNVQHGTITISASGAVAYTGAANYAGADSFSVRVADGAGGEVTGTINITVAAVNDAPAFTVTTFNISEDENLNGNLLPTDVDNTTLSVVLTGTPQHGTVTVAASGQFNYFPSANYFGVDTFNVSVNDGAGGMTPATVTINLANVNDVPYLINRSFTVNEDNVLNEQLHIDDWDFDPLTYTIDQAPTHGQVAVSSTGVLTYTPAPNYFGPDTLTISISDSPQTQTSWPVTITVNSVNDVPVAVNDEFRIADGAPKTMAVATNDTDVEAGTLTVSVLQQPVGGVVTVGASNVLTFTPANDFTGPITFTYRLTDSDGGHDDATVRALIGNFQGLIYLADDLTPGRQEIYLFDGLHSTRIVQAPVNNFEFITRFTVSDDGTKLLYVVAGPLVDEFYFKAINAPGQGTKIWANSPLNPPNAAGTARLALNRSGTHAIIEDRYSSANKRIWLVDTDTKVQTLIGGDVPQVVRASIILFNPINPGQIVLQGQVGGTVPTDGSEYYTAYITGVNGARTLFQIGQDYPQLGGAGSGFGFWFTGVAGQIVYHTEYLPHATPINKSLLMYDYNTLTEYVVHRRPTGNEYGITNLPAANADGSRIVYGFTEPNPTDGDGPAAFYASSPLAPSIATPLSTPYPRVGRIQFTSDGQIVILQASQGGSNPMELFAANTSNPAFQPTRVGKTLDAGEVLARVYVARRTQRLIVGYQTSPSTDTRMYNIPVNSTGTETPFTATLPYSGAPGEDIDDNGQHLAYAPVEGSRRMLRIMSTRALDYSIPVMGAGSTSGVTSFRWLPQP